jgi:acyl carrier protein
MSKTFERVKKLAVKHLGASAAKVKPDARFIKDLGADETTMTELIMAFEEEFGIEILEDDEAKFTTVKKAVAIIESKQG